MSTQETYELDGSTRFDFPHPVRDPQQLTVEVRPGNVVPPSDYEVVGYGPNATGVTIYYPDAPSDPDLELRITRFTEPDRVTRFSDGTPVQPKALDAEFDNLFQLYVDMPNYVDLAEDWASKDEDEEVEDGKYSARHWSAKAEQWAENPEDEETDGGGYSARHWALKAEEWAEKPEDEKTYDDGYSALHYSAKAEKSADDASSSASNAADSESNASTSESNAADSESEAASHRDKAEEWAENPEDEEVEDGKYSARHWSAKAEGHSSDASDSASSAESSANDAADSASSADSRASDAADSASDASSSASDAADSASAASDSADSAEDHYQSTKDISRHYLGVHSSDPSDDPNDGGELEEGDFYYNNSDQTLRFYDDGSWRITYDDTASVSPDADTLAKRDGDGRVKSEPGGSGRTSIVWDDTGTDDDEVPTNADLGSAAKVDTGTDDSEVPTNEDLPDSSSVSESALPNRIPVRDGSAELKVGAASEDSSAVNRGQDITWPGEHDFEVMPKYDGEPVVESGSNDDGEWTRWADGTQICYRVPTIGAVPDKDENNIARSESYEWTFPKEFDETPVVTCMAETYARWADTEGGGGTEYAEVLVLAADTSEVAFEASAVAHGRWSV